VSVGFAIGLCVKVSRQKHYVRFARYLIIDPAESPFYLMQPEVIIRDGVMQVGVKYTDCAPVTQPQNYLLHIPVGAQM
jgi:hypothetical protein